jgi:hypothetical protein
MDGCHSGVGSAGYPQTLSTILIVGRLACVASASNLMLDERCNAQRPENAQRADWHSLATVPKLGREMSDAASLSEYHRKEAFMPQRFGICEPAQVKCTMLQ